VPNRHLDYSKAAADVVFASGADEALHNALYLPIGQLLACERSLHKALDPDRPHNLDAVDVMMARDR
jgi:glucosamine 6-phosphate synthetase-like amidotransferase/phosphosugar isomerase protein